MEETLVGTLTIADYKAEIYSTSMPGEFRVVYMDPQGNILEEAPLTGISTYKQREPEILATLRKFRDGVTPPATPYQGDAGEY